jgi:thioredoxin 1
MQIKSLNIRKIERSWEALILLVVDQNNFEQEVLQADGFVLVDFWGESCEPCKALMPDVEMLANEYEDRAKFCKLNTNSARRLAISQRVLGLPTIVLYKGGQRVAEVTKGNATKAGIKAMLDANLQA